MENLSKYLNLFRYLIGLLYVALGAYFLANPTSFQVFIDNPDHVRIFGGVLVLYGGFRFYRTYKTLNPAKK